ncbi:MAG TPA: sugar phosphate isomerase/epimerase family protein, partial [Luteolibacter sp.]|nr:sugar phosphate isomerase/epimerase family protein [Luteolibacter sp.]
AAQLGYDAVELFLPGPDFVTTERVLELCEAHQLRVAAVGSGAGWLKHGLSLTDPSAATRKAALDFLLGMIEFGGRLKAPVILGSMQGRGGTEVTRDQALVWLAEALRVTGEAAAAHGVPFLYEPLNRYETPLINRLADAVAFLRSHDLRNILLLADLFHMNLEEADLAAAVLEAGPRIGHIHYADSNRRAMGFGHTDPGPILDALRKSGYSGYLSAEILPLPDALTAARQTLASIRPYL